MSGCLEDTWDLTEYYRDAARFDDAWRRMRDDTMPALKAQRQVLDDVSSVHAFLVASDAVEVELNHLRNYCAQRADLNAADNQAQAQKTQVNALYQDFGLLQTELTNYLLARDSAYWATLLADDALAPWRRMLTKMREHAAYTLPDAQEALLLPAYEALTNMNDTYNILSNADLVFPTVLAPDGHGVAANYTNRLNALSTSPDRAYRAAIDAGFVGIYKRYANTFAQNLNAYVSLSEKLAVAHHNESLFTATMREDSLTPAVYDALLEGARRNLGVIARKNAMRRKALGYDVLYGYDLRVPIGAAEPKTYDFPNAKRLLKQALAPLGGAYVDTLSTAFSNRWIDVYPKENKDTGAYSGCSIDLHPWILLNYTGDYGSVSTLAHELGHAVHQRRSYAAQRSEYNREPTALVSEVASTTNELLLSRAMIEQASSDAEKLFYLQQELSLLDNTFFGQCLFADFERQAHKLVEDGFALTADQLNGIYRSISEAYHPGVAQTEGGEAYWAVIPHFYYNYYVYRYAVAVSVSCNVVSGLLSDETRRAAYQRFLAAGNSLDAMALFALLGVDVTDPGYIQPLIARYGALLDQIDALLTCRFR